MKSKNKRLKWIIKNESIEKIKSKNKNEINIKMKQYKSVETKSKQ